MFKKGIIPDLIRSFFVRAIEISIR